MARISLVLTQLFFGVPADTCLCVAISPSHTQGEVLFTLPGYTEEESDRIYEQLLYLLCSPGHIGTMFQATSTNDITFWVLHPTVDRCVGSGHVFYSPRIVHMTGKVSCAACLHLGCCRHHAAVLFAFAVHR